LDQNSGTKRKRSCSRSLINKPRPAKRSKHQHLNERMCSFVIRSIFQILFIFISNKTNLYIFFVFFRIVDQDLQYEADTQLKTTNKNQHLSTNG
jgi:hypothetical protein